MTRLGSAIFSSVLLVHAVRSSTLSFNGVRSDTQNDEPCRVAEGVFVRYRATLVPSLIAAYRMNVRAAGALRHWATTTKSTVATVRAASSTTMATAASMVTASRLAVSAVATASRATLRKAASPSAQPRPARMTRGHFLLNNASKRSHSPRPIIRSVSRPRPSLWSRPRLAALSLAATARRPRIRMAQVPQMPQAQAQRAAAAVPPPALPKMRPRRSPTTLSRPVVLWLRQSC